MKLLSFNEGSSITEDQRLFYSTFASPGSFLIYLTFVIDLKNSLLDSDPRKMFTQSIKCNTLIAIHIFLIYY